MYDSIFKVSKGKGNSRAKVKASIQEERIQIWKGHFKNLLGNSPKVTIKPILKINNNQLEQFTEEELNVARTKVKKKKSCKPQRNISRRMEDKEIWWLTSSILQSRIWTK